MRQEVEKKEINKLHRKIKRSSEREWHKTRACSIGTYKVAGKCFVNFWLKSLKTKTSRKNDEKVKRKLNKVV